MLVLEQQIAKSKAFKQWFLTPQGMAIEKAFLEEIENFIQVFSGQCLLQMGECGANPWLADFNFSQQWIVSAQKNSSGSLVASLEDLPLERNSIDLVIAPLTMEAFSDKNAVIDEIDRVLKPMGCVLVFGINAWSLWSLAAKTGFIPCLAKNKPFIHSPFAVHRAFAQRGYRQCLLKGFWYLPPVNSKSWLHRLNFLNAVGKMLWPFPAGFYCYIAQKFEEGYPPLVMEAADKALVNGYKSRLQPVANSLSP